MKSKPMKKKCKAVWKNGEAVCVHYKEGFCMVEGDYVNCSLWDRFYKEKQK